MTIKCWNCGLEIQDTECFFSGHWVPESKSDGQRSFGCAPQQDYCFKCAYNGKIYAGALPDYPRCTCSTKIKCHLHKNG